MPRRSDSGRNLDLQGLKQASACASQAIEAFIATRDADAIAQAVLAVRFLEEFLEKYEDHKTRS